MMTIETLQEAFESEREAIGQLPPALPLAHLTFARWLGDILKIGRLQPQPCKVFDKDLLYFSYGGLFYRPKRIQTQNAVELPIALVFSPELLEVITSLFPFDTGAMANNPGFTEWKSKLAPFETRFRLSPTRGARDVATALVYLLYADNPRYLNGEVASIAAKGRTPPLPLLAEFLDDNLAPESDHRQRSIECLSDVAVALGRSLEWIGFPETLGTAQVMNSIYQWTQPHLPDFRAYPYHRNFNPAEIGAQLETWAHEAVIRKYAELRP